MMIFLLKFVFILIEQSVQNFLCQLFYQWIHSLAEHTILRSKVQCATLCSMAVCFAPLFPQSFLPLRRAIPIIIFHNNLSPHEFQSLTIIGKLQAVYWGVLRKFYKKNCQEIFPTIRMQKGSPIISNFLFYYYCFLLFQPFFIQIKDWGLYEIPKSLNSFTC